MKQFLLAACLIMVPVAIFSGGYKYLAPPAIAADQSLGDLSSMKSIITDVQAIVQTGDFEKAETRITDFETAWDNAEEKLRPLNKEAWGNVDDASDAALKALRKSPEAGKVSATLAALQSALDNPMGGADASSAGVKLVAGIADDTGHALPCEVMIKDVQSAVDGGKISEAKKSALGDFQAKALERCNADDDVHADEFSAQALALAGK
jgi:hypothetical protein